MADNTAEWHVMDRDHPPGAGSVLESGDFLLTVREVDPAHRRDPAHRAFWIVRVVGGTRVVGSGYADTPEAARVAAENCAAQAAVAGC